MKVKSKHQHFTELAMTGEDIKLHIQKVDLIFGGIKLIGFTILIIIKNLTSTINY